METIKSLAIILMTSVLVNNYVLSKFLGICPFLGVSKKIDQASGMGAAVTFVMLMATVATYPIQQFLLEPFGLGYMRTIVFILVIAALVQLVEIVLKKYVPALHASLGIYLPLITTNCAVLGVTLNNVNEGYDFLSSLVNSLGAGLGFLLAMVLFAGVRSRLESANPPKSFRGLPITLVSASIVAMSFLGFTGLVDGIFSYEFTIHPIVSAAFVVVVIGAVCAIMLVLASKFFAVEENEMTQKVRDCLPGANCGACGYAGCDGYAKAMAEDREKPNLCIPGGDTVAKQLSDVLGVDFEDVAAQVAVVHCNGNRSTAKAKNDYEGIRTCAAAKLYYGGQGSCVNGCIGFGDCVEACPQNAICVDNGVARVDTRSCVGCGVCISACPKGLISLMADKESVLVLCKNTEKGAVVRGQCESGCIGCKKCEKNCETGAIKVVNNLAVVDYDKCTRCNKCAENCPVGCILISDFKGVHNHKYK